MLSEKEILEKLKNVKDPEVGMDIVVLGLIRKITVDDDGVEVLMTLTSPFCPFADKLVLGVETEIKKMEGSGDVRVEITFDPPWEPPEEVRAMMQI